MKKILLLIIGLIILTGCNELSNTPTKRVEDFLRKYQALDNDVLTDLDRVIENEINFTNEQRERYRDIMRKHYQNMSYIVKEEEINGNKAIITVEITVTDFNLAMDESSRHLMENPESFNNELGEYDITLYNNYRLDRLNEAKEKVKYTIHFVVTKTDGQWAVDSLDNNSLDKINGSYRY